MDFTYRGKPIMPTKAALDELSEIDLNLYEVPIMHENRKLWMKQSEIQSIFLAKEFSIFGILKIRPEPEGRANSGRSEAESRVVGFS